MSKQTEGQPYDVGYGKPPKHTRFAPGQSGNPRGRPKGALNLATTINRALQEKVVIVEGGRRRSISKLEAAIKALVNRAVKGDARAMQQLLNLASLIGAEPPKSSKELAPDDAAIVASLLERAEGSGEQFELSEDEDEDA